MVDGRWDAEFRASARDIAVQRINLRALAAVHVLRSEEHTSELQSQSNLVCRLLLEKKNTDLCVDGHMHASADRDVYVSATAQLLVELPYRYHLLRYLDIHHTMDTRPRGDANWHSQL